MSIFPFIIVGVLLVIAIILYIVGIPTLLNTKSYTLSFDGKIRKYRIHIPSNIEGEKPALVMMLHGYGDYPVLSELYTGWSKKADKEKFIVVYPYGTNSEKKKKFSWNGGSCCGASLDNKTDDVGFLTSLIESLEKKYSIDPNKIYLTGFSNGAVMTYRMGAEKSNLFAAIAPVSGSIGGTVSKDFYTIPPAKKTLPIIIFHGTADLAVPYNGGINEKKDARFVSVKDSVLYWVENNKCTNKPVTIKTDYYVHDTYNECDNENEVQLYTLKNSGHVWFGGPANYIFYPFIKKLSATDIIWDFFKAHSKS